ncbi:MAG: aminomethyl-transferring glycine dehydrogenase subunit GcvPA [Candidatus Schekmanbacteria bacterium]|nr:aminomethyl-transferring glycine dehydrogenase subunit GcvPA [Candidatus Schekmanbacteria bacterium]
MKYIPNTAEDRANILKTLGKSNFSELLGDIPGNIVLKENIDIPAPVGEIDVERSLEGLSERNSHNHQILSFAGAGSYDHYIPAHIDSITSRSEFLTAYTPYQPEISQGTLQSIYEYQSIICELTGLDVANASMYDGSSALAEAVIMAARIKKGNKVVVAGTVNPLYCRVIETYVQGLGIEVVYVKTDNGVLDLDHLKSLISDDVIAAVFQYPNFFGNIEDAKELSELVKSKGAVLIFSVDPISLGILESPAKFGADIITGEGQSAGIPVSFGGPYLGFFACRREHMRQIPGRIVGATVDSAGHRGYVLTLQTREQHIRREKATSNICSNQALMALASTIYFVSLGKEGLREVALQCLSKSHYAANELCKNSEIELLNDMPFFKEFAVRLPVQGKVVIDRMSLAGILPGVHLELLGDEYANVLLVAVTEKRNKNEISSLVSGLNKVLKQVL